MMVQLNSTLDPPTNRCRFVVVEIDFVSPLQKSAMSQGPLSARQSSLGPWNVFGGQSAEAPSQISVPTSQGPSEARHTRPAEAGMTAQVPLLGAPAAWLQKEQFSEQIPLLALRST